MKTTKEMIEVMQAFDRGEQIEFKHIDSDDWMLAFAGSPMSWNWYDFDYRVKPKPKLIPYESEQEFYEAMKAHGQYLKMICFNGYFWCPTTIESDDIWIGGVRVTYEELLKEYEFVDGTPCGKEVTE